MELSPLTESRNELYSPSASNQLIIAGAGSGKTYTLVNTVVNRIQNGEIDPLSDDEEVIIFTFTENAAEELIVRLSQKLERDELILNEIYVGTIHGWCNQYLDQNANLANTKILDELERSQLIQRIHGLLNLDEIYETDFFHRQIELFENDLEVYYNENFSLADPVIDPEVEPAIRQYVNFIEEQRLIDFGSLIKRAIQEVRQGSEEDTHYHLFIDEYQDVNPAQVELFKTMAACGDASTVFAVGDPRQAIYQWRGGDINRILEFDEDFDDPEAYTIRTNRRSRTGIVEFSNAIYSDMDSISVDLGGMEPHSSRADVGVSVIGDTVSTEHPVELADRIVQLHEEDDVPLSDIAVLMRSVAGSYGTELMDHLDERGVRYHSPNRNSGTEFVEEVVFSVIELIQIIEDTEDRNFQTQQEQREIQDRISELCSSISAWVESSPTDVHIAAADWHHELTKGGPEYDNEQYNLRRQFYTFCEEIGLLIGPQDVDLQEGFSSVTQIMKSIEEVYRRRLQGRSNVRSGPLTVLTQNLKWQLENRLERWAETGMGLQERDAVTVSTVHAAKGLQWPVVLVPHLTKNRFPVRNQPHATTFPQDIAERYGTTTEDERRLWYVAVTRARDRLYFFARDQKDIGPFAYPNQLNNMERAAQAGREQVSGPSTIEPSEDEPEYIHAGVSAFLLLLECPYHFHMRHSVGVNPPVGKQFGAGNVLHRTIERVVDGDDDGLTEITREEVYLPLAGYGDERRMQNAVRNKVQKLIETGGISDVDFSEESFTIQLENLVVSGIVDAIRELEDGIEVLDWKSSLHDEFLQRYQRQILLYALALRRIGTDVAGGRLADLSIDNPVQESIEVDVSADAATSLINESSTRLERLSEEGPYTTPSSTACEICDISSICPDDCS